MLFRKNARRVFCLILAGMLLLLTACDKNGKTTGTVNEGDQSEYVYVPQYIEWKVDGNPQIIGYKDGKLLSYIIEVNQDEETIGGHLAAYDIEMGEESTTPLSLELTGDNYLGSLSLMADGGFMGVYTQASHTKEDYSDYTQKQQVLLLAADGTVKNTIEMSAISNDSEAYIQGLACDGKGQLYIGLSGNNGESFEVAVFSPEGQKVDSISIPSWMNGMFQTQSGAVYAMYWGENNMVAKRIDAEAGDAQPVSITHCNGNVNYAGGESVFTTDSTILYRYDLSTGTEERVLDWVESDINSDNIVNVFEMEDDRIFAALYDYSADNSEMEFAVMSKVKASEIVKKEELIYGCMYADSEVQKSIINFNKNSNEYRIKIKEYSSDDWEAAITQFNNDITSGNAPDIIDLSNGINANAYIAKGLFEDLYPYMDKDEEINRDDFLSNVLTACECDGKLYSLPTGFCINTMLARKSEVGDKSGWTLDEMMQYVDSKGDDVQIFEYQTKEGTLYSCALNNMNEFVNWEDGTCRFDSEEFVKLLEFCNRFESVENMDYDYETAPSLPELLESRKLLFAELYMSNPDSYEIYNQLYKNDMALIGYPTSDGGNGAVLNSNGVEMAISTKCKNKDAAWELIKSMLTKEAQEAEFRYAFPVRKDSLDQMLTDSMKEQDGSSSWGWNDVSVTVKATTQEEVDDIHALIDGTTNFSRYDQSIAEIIEEETKPYFSGQKSAQDTANVIQSRVQIYVNESR